MHDSSAGASPAEAWLSRLLRDAEGSVSLETVSLGESQVMPSGAPDGEVAANRDDDQNEALDLDDSFDPDEAWLALACVDLPQGVGKVVMSGPG